MSETRTLPCPACGQSLEADPRMIQGIVACAACGNHVSIDRRDGRVEASLPQGRPIEFANTSEAITAAPAAHAKAPGAAADAADAPAPDFKVSLAGPGEVWAIAALLTPVVALCIYFVTDKESMPVMEVIPVGTILLTAILLTIDAIRLGRTDMRGWRRGGFIVFTFLFLGMLIFWVVFYPFAFFRRRHFGKPNLGFFAILIVALFFGVPISRGLIDYFVHDKDPPACTDPQVITLVDGLARRIVAGWPQGIELKSISDHRELKYDPVARTRRGRCTLNIKDELGRPEKVTLSYEVLLVWVDRNKLGPWVRTIPENEDPRGFLGLALHDVIRVKKHGEIPFKVGEGAVQVSFSDHEKLLAHDIIVCVNQCILDSNDPNKHFRQMEIDLVPESRVELQILRRDRHREWQRHDVQLLVKKRPPGLREE